MIRTTTITLAMLAVLLTGCSADKPLNPSFPLTLDESKAALRAMRDDPKPLQRPVVISDGWFSPGFNAHSIEQSIHKHTGDERTVQSVYFSTATFETSRDRLISKLEERFPSDDPDWTVEVDAIGVSMGGLVARYAALPRTDGGKRLRINTLFTLATPHTGAEDANIWTLDQRVRDMREGSQFLTNLNSALPDTDYTLICYVRLGDSIVGARNTAPPDQTPFWVQNKPLEGPHRNIATDQRLLADILRRLRQEQPFTTHPPAPLPDSVQRPDAD